MPVIVAFWHGQHFMMPFLKLEQYKKGEIFVRAIADARGKAALGRLWQGPDTLPRDGEIEHPERWIARVLDGHPAELASGS